MKRIASALAAVAVATLGTLAFASPAVAREGEPHPVKSDCVEGWYTNPDEGDRLPEQTEGGLLFKPADLVHHVADLPLADLQPGTYEASPAPDQPSFFSVEVRDGSSNYGTLRWDPAASLWSITIGAGGSATAGTFTNANPVDLLDGKRSKWGTADFDAATTVVSFGVGYTQNPPGSVETTVSSVTFVETTYDLTCKPEPPATEPAATTSTSAAPTLPVTGSGLTGLVAVGALLVVGGAVLVYARRRRA